MKANKFDQLSPEDQHHIIDLCNHNTYPKVVQILAQPRPEGLALNTSVPALCRFYTSWNPINQQAKLMEQLGKSLRVCRQATPLAADDRAAVGSAKQLAGRMPAAHHAAEFAHCLGSPG